MHICSCTLYGRPPKSAVLAAVTSAGYHCCWICSAFFFQSVSNAESPCPCSADICRSVSGTQYCQQIAVKDSVVGLYDCTDIEEENLYPEPRTIARTLPARAKVVKLPSTYWPFSFRWPMLICTAAWSLAVISLFVYALHSREHPVSEAWEKLYPHA